MISNERSGICFAWWIVRQPSHKTELVQSRSTRSIARSMFPVNVPVMNAPKSQSYRRGEPLKRPFFLDPIGDRCNVFRKLELNSGPWSTTCQVRFPHAGLRPVWAGSSHLFIPRSLHKLIQLLLLCDPSKLFLRSSVTPFGCLSLSLPLHFASSSSSSRRHYFLNFVDCVDRIQLRLFRTRRPLLLSPISHRIAHVPIIHHGANINSQVHPITPQTFLGSPNPQCSE